MPLCRVESIEVIGNKEYEYQKLRREKLVYIEGKPDCIDGKMICPKCNEPMESPMGIYNGFIDVDDNDMCIKTYSYECKNFHSMGWTEKV